MRRSNSDEALLRKIVLRYGSPSLILLDQSGCFLSQIAQSLWSVTNTKVKVISPYNHGSNVVKRSIGSISNLLASNLKDKAKNWDSYCESACYAHNTHKTVHTG